jgi:hypothetical protein
MPLAALPFGPTPILAIGLGAFDGEISPEDVLRMINEIDRILRELWEQLDEDERRRILEYILDIYSAIRAIRIHGLTPEDLARLNEAMRNLFEFLKYFSGGRYLSTVFQRLMTVMLRFAQGAAGAAESAANSWILALLGRLLFYLAWFLLWCKIGNWLWSHHVAGSTQTYTDWWGDRFYEFYKSVAGYGCDELLEEWHKADRALRDAEAAGAGIGELTNAAIDAESWAKVLLDHCPDLSIKNVVRARIDYYEGIVKRFDDLIGGH